MPPGPRRRLPGVVVAVSVGVVSLAAGAGPAVGAGAGPAVGAGAGPAGTAPVAGSAAAAADTPILSVRRLPDWVEDTTADQRVAAALPAALHGLGGAAATSCLVVERDGTTVFSDHPTQEEIPASNMKVLTATAVLDRISAAARLRTKVTESGSRTGGTLRGNLYLVGAGDPFLWTPAYVADQDPPESMYTSLPQLAAQVRAAGITSVQGSIFGDESLFDTQRGVPSWKSSYESDGDVGPLSALEVNNGFVLTPPYGPAAAPATMAASVFRSLLVADGVKVTGPPGTSDAPAGATVVTSIASATMGRTVGAVLRVSDDTGAELLTKLLGKRFGAGGTTAAGVAVARAALRSDGLPVSQLTADDGSGLSRDDRVTCGLMVDDLRHVGTGSPIFAGLPVAGSTGTLDDRMNGTAAAGRLHAKTGTLDGVSALSGFVLPAGGLGPTPATRAPIVFSFIANGVPDDDTGVDVGDAVGVALASADTGLPPLSDALPGPRSVPGSR